MVQRIYPTGKHQVDIAVKQDGVGIEFNREIDVPENEWFYIALADFTAGHQFGNVAPTTDSDSLTVSGREVALRFI